MSDEYEAESKFLAKNYKAFLYDLLQEWKQGEIELQPPPAFRHVYELIINHSVDIKNQQLTYLDMIYMMDQVAKFVSYLNKNGIEYGNFTACNATRLSDSDIAQLLLSGGDNR